MRTISLAVLWLTGSLLAACHADSVGTRSDAAPASDGATRDAGADAREAGASRPRDDDADVRNPSRQACANSIGCDFDAPCDGCCMMGYCVPSGYSCGADAGVCEGSSCSGVGAKGQACFHGIAECTDMEWAGCVDSLSTCGAGDRCVACGAAGKPCCGEEEQCAAGMYCDSTTTCNPHCGGVGEPCCVTANDIGYQCNDGLTCLFYGETTFPQCEALPRCDGGACAPCGGDEQPCCGDGGCLPYAGACMTESLTGTQLDASTCIAIHKK